MLPLLFVTLVLATHSHRVDSADCPPQSLPVGNYKRNMQHHMLLAELQKLFPESSNPAGSVSLGANVLYRVSSNKELEICFLHDGGVIPSTVGYYEFDPITRSAKQLVVLFPNSQCTRIGDTINIGSFSEGTHLGFYMIAPQNSTSYMFWSSITKINENTDGIHHVSQTFIHNLFLVGFEDILGGGDEDFNDVILSVSEVEMVSCLQNTNQKCNEGASLLVTISSIFLGFAGAAIQTLIDKIKKSSYPARIVQLSLCLLSLVIFLVSLIMSITVRLDGTNIGCTAVELCPRIDATIGLVAAGVFLLLISVILTSRTKPVVNV